MYAFAEGLSHEGKGADKDLEDPQSDPDRHGNDEEGADGREGGQNAVREKHDDVRDEDVHARLRMRFYRGKGGNSRSQNKKV